MHFISQEKFYITHVMSAQDFLDRYPSKAEDCRTDLFTHSIALSNSNSDCGRSDSPVTNLEFGDVGMGAGAPVSRSIR
jgi:hypothetical protein